MNKKVFDTQKIAEKYIVDTIENILNANPQSSFCLAAGHSSLGVFDEIVERNLDLSKARFVGLDDWLNIDPNADGSCANFLNTNFFSRINAKTENIRLFDSLSNNPEKECQSVEAQIEAWGGLDYLLLGVGMNGHLALNEPGDSFSQGAHVAPLSEKTKEVAVKYFREGMPKIEYGITLGIKNILAAKKIQLGIFGAHKAEVVKKLFSYQAPSEDFPASVLITAENAEIILDKALAE